MKNVDDFIASGILEMYVLGQATAEEHAEVEQMAALFPAVTVEINEIEKALERYASLHSKEPSATMKPNIMAGIDYTIRLQNGEQLSNPPMLNDNSVPEDFLEWTSREDMVPGEYDDIFVKLISANDERMIGIVWIKEMAPEEVHKDEYESFLILEGTCDIAVGESVFPMKPGDFLTIPLHVAHHITVTSHFPCKVILQRLAA